MKRAKYVVHLPDGNVARFSDCDDALKYGRQRSEMGVTIEVSAPDGLIGQFRYTKATAEFAHLDKPQ